MDGMKKVGLDFGLLWLRVLTGAGIAVHGYGKVFTPGFMEQFAGNVEKMGFPVPIVFAWAAALSEFLGGIFVAVGLGTRIASTLIATTMGVAFFVTHANDPFKVKELAAAYGTIAVALLLTGGGSYSFDSWFWKRKKKDEIKKG